MSSLSSTLLRLLCLLIYLIQSISALICPSPAAAGASHRNKTCPDFKADPSNEFCCASKLPTVTSVQHTTREKQHGYYCCSKTEFDQKQQEAADQEFHQFMKSYLVVIILCSLISLGLSILVISILCKKFQRCPLYTDGTNLQHSVQANSMYRPVDTIPPKIYEAPPPYECFVPPPDQARNDWNCVLENEVNGARRLAPLA